MVNSQNFVKSFESTLKVLFFFFAFNISFMVFLTFAVEPRREEASARAVEADVFHAACVTDIGAHQAAVVIVHIPYQQL